MKINFNDLSKQWDIIREDVQPKLDTLFRESNFVGGAPIAEFEKNFAEYCGTDYAVAVSNGTDALKLSIAAFQVKSPCLILIPANTFIATALAATYLNDAEYDIVLIDCDEYYQIDTGLLRNYLDEHAKHYSSIIIIPVHLYGHPADMAEINYIAAEFVAYILEDASQAHGAMVMNKKVGSIGDIAAFSLYPGKNLGAAGDAGIITTDNEYVANRLKKLRNYGSIDKRNYDYKGWNNRMDTIQAIIVNEKLKHLDDWNLERNRVAYGYLKKINNDQITLPMNADHVAYNVYHNFPIRLQNRDEFQAYLARHDIPSIIHYRMPIQKTVAFGNLRYSKCPNTLKYADEIISLPMSPFITYEEVDYITGIINEY